MQQNTPEEWKVEYLLTYLLRGAQTFLKR